MQFGVIATHLVGAHKTPKRSVYPSKESDCDGNGWLSGTLQSY